MLDDATKAIAVRISVLAAVMMAAAHIHCARAQPLPSQPQQSFLRDADDAFQSGLDAVENKNWDRAIEYFFKAHRINFDNGDWRDWRSKYKAPILLNLGLAHHNAGHDLIAICWFHAYLAAEPDALNSAEVAKTINRLKERAQERIRVASQAIFAGQGGADVPLARFGFINDALVAAAGHNEELIWAVYATGLARSGDIAGATAALEHIKTPAARDRYLDSARDNALDEEWRFLVEAQDYDAARTVAGQINDPAHRQMRIDDSHPRTTSVMSISRQGLFVQDWVSCAELFSGTQQPERDHDVLWRFDAAMEKIKRLRSLEQQQFELERFIEIYVFDFNTILRLERAQERRASYKK